MTNRDRFNKLQAQIRDLDRQQNELRIDLRVKYSDPCYASKTERKRLEQFSARIDRLAGKVFTILDTDSPRDWRSGAPWHWILTTLTYDDAITRGQLAIVPPPAYGYTDRDMQRFAMPLKTEAA
jgi:hypothetical protein